MNSLLNLSSTVTTMSSLELSELTGKQHKDVIRDIRSMLETLQKDGAFLHHHRESKDARGYTTMFYLGKELTYTLLTGYSVPLRNKVIVRWQELENGQQPVAPPPPPPQPLLLMPPIEEAARAASAISDCLRLEGTERASMLASTIKLKAPEYLPLLPAYATNAPRTQDGKLLGGEGNSKAAFAASALLKKFNSQLSIHAFNKLAEASGFLETIERPSTKHEGLAKTFKSVTDKGLEYGYNLSHENSKGSTQPVWFQHKFEELLETLTK